MEINGGVLVRNEVNQNAMGGSEIIATTLAERLDKNLLKDFQIVNSRVRTLDETKIRIFLAHDLPGDPESEFLKSGGWNKFHLIVFVSNWQMQKYIAHYGIPWSKCLVLQNAIDPIITHEKPNDGNLRLAYWATPHRGLTLLVPVFTELCKKYDNIELDVYSSFKLYGWEQRDEPFKDLFAACENHPKINYHGTVANEVLRDNLTKTHIMAYPSIWQETSCICLMEAMSAGLVCVHSNLGALAETSANWTHMYQYQDDPNDHAQSLYQVLDSTIANYWDEAIQSKLASQQAYANVFYNWHARVHQWNSLLASMVASIPMEDRKLTPSTTEMFTYRT